MLERTGFFAESWNVAWRKKTQGILLENQSEPFNILKNSFRNWAADPFVFKYNGETYIFAELYDYILARGCLGYCKWQGDHFGKWKKVISEPYHLSYPCIFEKDDGIYIMPESGADRSLYCYKAIRFPDQWKRMPILRKDVVLGDTTPFTWNDHDYAFSYDVENTQSYYLKLLDLENPKKDCDFKKLELQEMRRPAGKIFQHKGRWIRPAQNCTHSYGEGLVFYEFTLNDEFFREEAVEHIYPHELQFSKMIPMDGMHTYNFNDEFEIIDLKTRRFNLLNFVCRIAHKIWRKK